jgi:hypothetical protein
MSCAHCQERPAVCIGSYERQESIEAACDICCGHGNEDGWCLQTEQLADREKLVEEVIRLSKARDAVGPYAHKTKARYASLLQVAARKLAGFKP